MPCNRFCCLAIKSVDYLIWSFVCFSFERSSFIVILQLRNELFDVKYLHFKPKMPCIHFLRLWMLTINVKSTEMHQHRASEIDVFIRLTDWCINSRFIHQSEVQQARSLLSTPLFFLLTSFSFTLDIHIMFSCFNREKDAT